MLRSLLLLCVVLAAPMAAQPGSPPPFNVYLDCPDGGCDFDFFRTEIIQVNWVRDREVADLHVLVTRQSTGAGGDEYTFTFLGLRRFSGITDTLRYVALPAVSQDDRRRGVARTLRLGFVRYLARTPHAAGITVNLGEAGAQPAQTSRAGDRWNAWVLGISFNGFTHGERSYKFFNLGGSMTADRITEQWKTRLRVNESYSETHNTFPICNSSNICRDTTYQYFQRSYNGSALQVRSLGAHWSAGLRGGIEASTFRNYRRVLRVAPAIEFNVFPYGQSTRRQLRVEYNIGYAHYTYNDTTIRDRLRESMPNQQLQVNMATREPWGSIDVGIHGISYLRERELYRLGSFGEVDLRLYRGLSLNFEAGYDVIRDQFTLAKKDFSPEEILTRQFQQRTTYSYFGRVGFRYTFGSIFNNVVNPRMAN